MENCPIQSILNIKRNEWQQIEVKTSQNKPKQDEASPVETTNSLAVLTDVVDDNTTTNAQPVNTTTNNNVVEAKKTNIQFSNQMNDYRTKQNKRLSKVKVTNVIDNPVQKVFAIGDLVVKNMYQNKINHASGVKSRARHTAEQRSGKCRKI